MPTKWWLSFAVVPVFVALLGLSTRASAPATLFGDPLPGLSPEQEARFLAGKQEFEEVEEIDEGLGPVFNDRSCAACHSGPAVGGGSVTLVTRFGTTTDGKFDPLTALGGSLIQTHGIGRVGDCNYVGEVVPAGATIVAQRRTTPLFGLGLVDAVPDDYFVELAERQARDQDRIGGRPNMVMNLAEGRPRVGKFGWKGQVPSLAQFAGDAYLNEMGITNPLFPSENCPLGDCALLACAAADGLEDDGSGVQRFIDFMTLLAPPPLPPNTPDVNAGQAIFKQIGCASCHLPTLRTERNPVVALSNVEFHPYSDFLLHDMGALGDGIEQGQATGGEIRTAPLWGVGSQVLLLHDGRATSLSDAILAHDGQGRAARDRFATLPTEKKSRLLVFLRAL
jgi:CxxC motif-containing protein (DUF1111 family)